MNLSSAACPRQASRAYFVSGTANRKEGQPPRLPLFLPLYAGSPFLLDACFLKPAPQPSITRVYASRMEEPSPETA